MFNDPNSELCSKEVLSPVGLIALSLILLSLMFFWLPSAQAQQDAGWTGNFARDPGFEEDFVHLHGEGHYLSFKGDWFYNQKDYVPDYWTFAGKGSWIWNGEAPHSGGRSLVLGADSSVSQRYEGAIYHEGGGAWGGVEVKPIPLMHPERLAQPWRATVWCRGGGTLSCGGVEAKASDGSQWEQIKVEVPVDKVSKDGSMTVTLTGPGEFDDLVVQEQLAPTPNLMPDAGFESLDQQGYPAGWSRQKKFDWIGPTYYVWTDWNHFHDENRGPVIIDRLIKHSGRQSLRFDVYPGDEKFIESKLIRLNQDQTHVIEVGVMVRADRIKMIDIRAVDEDGANLPSVRPIQPEWNIGGTALFGNGTFEWRYVRKLFALPFNEPIKGIKVRLAARGFNAHTLDDSGTRSYACQVGTVWWDDVRVVERTSTAAELKVRGVTIPTAATIPNDAIDASLDLGERLYGLNRLRLDVTNEGKSAQFQLKLTRSLPGTAPVTTTSQTLTLAKGRRGVLEAPYRITNLMGDFKQQGKLRLQLLREGTVLTDTTYAFNTWPVVVDIDISRHYNLPHENPVTASFNLGVGAATLARTSKLEIELVRLSDGASLGKQVITNLPAAFARTRAVLPREREQSYEFNMPTPGWWTDQTNLLITKLDLSKLKVWPHDKPTRDTVVKVRGLDAAGRVLFTERSDGLCRIQAPPSQPPIQSVQVRRDGAVLINGQPRFLTGATHHNQRTDYAPPLIAQLGLMGHRLPQQEGGKFENIKKMWESHRLYALQLKPVSGDVGTQNYISLTEEQRQALKEGKKKPADFGIINSTADMTPEQKQALEEFTKAGGMQNVVSINTGGWETVVTDTPEARKNHQELNDWIRRLTQRPIAISTGNHYNAWNMPEYPYYDIDHAETEMWGPMDFNVIFTPYMKRLRKDPTAWVYLPQLYDNTPYERYRFETYENIIRGSAGVSMIQGIGDPTFTRGLAGELRYLQAPLHSLEPAPKVTLQPDISHMVRRYKGKTYLVVTNAGPIILGNWKWNSGTKYSGLASHEGDSVNRMWRRPDGMRLHGFRGLPRPELIKAGDKIVQYVWLDPKSKPDWVMVAVRGDGRFSHAGVLGNFDFKRFREQYGNIFMYSELEHTVWNEINYILDPPTYQRAIKLMGKEWADNLKKLADRERLRVDAKIYQSQHFHKVGKLLPTGKWYRIELDAKQLGLVGKLVDGFAYLTRNGRALWDYSALVRGGKVVRVFCEDSAGTNRSLLKTVRITVPGLKTGAKINVLFEGRTLTARNNSFIDNFEGVDTYGHEAGGVAGDMFGYVQDINRDLPRMMPSGYGYTYGPTAVHIYEIGD